MALDDVAAKENETNSSNMQPLTNLNPDAPEFTKDIRKKSKELPLDMNVEFIPQNPYTLPGHAQTLGNSDPFPGNDKNVSFMDTASAEFRNFNETYAGIAGASYKANEGSIFEDVAPADWNPKSDPSKYANVRPQYLNYIFESKGPKDQEYRLQKVMQEQHDDDALANGSFSAKLLGGLTGVVTDPISYIPIVGWAKYAKFAPTIVGSMSRALPGVAAQSVLQTAGEQANTVNGNMVDFFTDSFVRTSLNTVLFAAGGAAALTADKMNLWNARDLLKTYVEGVDLKFKTDAEGKILGFEAFGEKTAQNAQRFSFAQDLANSQFAKKGIFKIPYAGAATLKFLSMPVLGTPLPKLLNSTFKTAAGYYDRLIDHTIHTVGLEKGEVAPVKFSSLMNQEFAGIRAMQTQISAMHLERNGFDITDRSLGGLVNLGLNLKDKGLKALGQSLDNTGYVSKDTFHSEIEEVLRNDTSSQHAPVNDAALMIRKHLDKTYSAYRKAYNLPETWLPPKTAESYLMRVYDTEYMNSHQNEWVSAVSNWFAKADSVISERMTPIRQINEDINAHTENHRSLVNREGVTDNEVKISSDQLMAKKSRKKALEESLQNELRSDPELTLHVHDWNALSADEAKQVQALTKRVDIAKEAIDNEKKLLADVKSQASKKNQAVLESKTAGTAKGNVEKAESHNDAITKHEQRIAEYQKEYEEEQQILQDKMHNGEVPSNLFTQEKDSFVYHLKDPKDRLKFRDEYEFHGDRESAAKAYYDTIMNQTPEDTINQVMGKFTGNRTENHIKQRTLLIPDHILYDNNFMAKDLMSKVSNYTTYLSRRTHLKNVFKDVSHSGGIEPILEELAREHERYREPLNARKAEIDAKLQTDISTKERDSLLKLKSAVEKELNSKRSDFEKEKKQMSFLYEKAMGIQKISRRAQQIKSAVMSITAIGNLPFVPFTMINDISAIGLQHGIWPFIRDGVYPVIQSMAGLLKTSDSQALRETAPSVHLALQDVLNGYADRNWSMANNPYLNLGKFVNGLEKMAHFSSNFTLTNFIDNGLQRITSSVTQSEFMRILHKFQDGTMTKKEGLYIRKYGIDPEKWGKRMVDAFKKDGGGKTALGGYQSNFWHWQDLEAANEIGDAVFRSVKDTQIQQGIADSPFWTDPNSDLGILGSIIKGFNGWTYASVNRYVIPSMQQADAQKLIGVMFMLGTGALVSPLRRMARNEDPYPANVTDEQMMWQTIQDSGYFSYFANIMADANLLSGDTLMGNLKNDKYKDRTRVGLLGPAFGTANRMADIISAAGSGEWNEADMKKAARMVPIANASWTYAMSEKLIEGIGLPKTRANASAMKRANQ